MAWLDRHCFVTCVPTPGCMVSHFYLDLFFILTQPATLPTELLWETFSPTPPNTAARTDFLPLFFFFWDWTPQPLLQFTDWGGSAAALPRLFPRQDFLG